MSSVTTSTAKDIQTDYMTLLVTQLQNQNPLEPMSTDQMSSQLAQFSELEQLESINSRFEDLLNTTQETYANSLIGKQVTFEDPDGDGTETLSGTVDAVSNEQEDLTLLVGSYPLTLEDILTIKP